MACGAGDQNIFVRRADFEAAGGYDEALPIMEDADLSIRMHERGTLLRPGKVSPLPLCHIAWLGSYMFSSIAVWCSAMQCTASTLAGVRTW